jgi:probable phosphoglycerate mutase
LGLPIHTSTDLRELDIGRWEGLRIADVKRDEPEALAFYRQRIPEANAGGGETRLQLRQRITRIMNEIAVENDGKTVLIGSHGGAIRALCCAWMGYTIEEIDKTTDLKNASITIVRYDAETKHAEFVLYNYNEHLGDLAT